MQATTALCLVLVTAVGAMGTTRNGTDIKKTGNIYISDCYLSVMKPGEVKTKTMSRRNTDPKANTDGPVYENLYVWDSARASATGRPELYRQTLYNNINRYSVTIRNILDCDNCIGGDGKCLPETKRIIETKATEIFRNVPQGRIPAYTIMGENWDIYLMDCYLDSSNFALGTTTTENIYITDSDSATERLPKQISTISTKSYNVTIENVNDYDHCVIADAPCWPYEKRTIEITAIE